MKYKTVQDVCHMLLSLILQKNTTTFKVSLRYYIFTFICNQFYLFDIIKLLKNNNLYYTFVVQQYVYDLASPIAFSCTCICNKTHLDIRVFSLLYYKIKLKRNNEDSLKSKRNRTKEDIKYTTIPRRKKITTFGNLNYKQSNSVFPVILYYCWT